MGTTLEVRTALRRRRKVRQEIAALIVFHKPTFCLKKANNTTQLVLGGSINSTSHVYMPTAQIKLASTVVEVMVRDIRRRLPRIPTSYHLPACLMDRSEVEKNDPPVLQLLF
ncbi:hypothetical protein AVEN_194583-1 [Araneus ventricosus]|uniref:Uncharacterized protein n=1 Tax=Araneus ventricosus TaxID=182803 RepID=A0A4Y2A6T2_ARAVE|nr:hypothetical protein AVEN_194583-1 [Araneus ventricosus]